MTVGETLLKFTDYPFAYSLVFIGAGMLGVSLTQNNFYLLGIAGALGTLLTITDPGGAYVRYQLEHRLNKFKNKINKENDECFDYQKSAIHSRAIGIEIDRIVAMIYFVLTAFIFLVGIVFPSSILASNFIIYGQASKVICDSTCVITYSIIGCFVIFGSLVIFAHRRWSELDEKVATAGVHQFAIGNENATRNSVENMTRAIDLGDWSSAEKWGEKIKDEIRYKKGKRDVVIKAAETVYKPLNSEFTRIQTTIETMQIRRIYPMINFGAWLAIKQNLAHLIIDDSDFRESMDNFQNKINQHDALVTKNHKIIVDIINQIMIKIYEKNITMVEYRAETSEGTRHVDLVNCALLNIHPKDYEPLSKPHSIRIAYVENSTKHEEIMDSLEKINLFHDGWVEINKKVEAVPDVKTMKNLVKEIEIENRKLLEISTERFGLQYKV